MPVAAPEDVAVAEPVVALLEPDDGLGAADEPVAEPPVTVGTGIAGALDTVGTDAAGVTWIWPSENWETGAREVVDAGGGGVLVMEAQGVVATWTWPEVGGQ